MAAPLWKTFNGFMLSPSKFVLFFCCLEGNSHWRKILVAFCIINILFCKRNLDLSPPACFVLILGGMAVEVCVGARFSIRFFFSRLLCRSRRVSCGWSIWSTDQSFRRHSQLTPDFSSAGPGGRHTSARRHFEEEGRHADPTPRPQRGHHADQQ